jgi:hypothetical protein
LDSSRSFAASAFASVGWQNGNRGWIQKNTHTLHRKKRVQKVQCTHRIICSVGSLDEQNKMVDWPFTCLLQCTVVLRRSHSDGSHGVAFWSVQL